MITTTVVFVDRLLMSQTLLLRINIKMDTYSPLMFLERCSVWVSADLKHEDEMQQVREEIWERNSDCYCTNWHQQHSNHFCHHTHTDLHDQSLPCVCVCVCRDGWRGQRGADCCRRCWICRSSSTRTLSWTRWDRRPPGDELNTHLSEVNLRRLMPELL